MILARGKALSAARPVAGARPQNKGVDFAGLVETAGFDWPTFRRFRVSLPVFLLEMNSLHDMVT